MINVSPLLGKHHEQLPKAEEINKDLLPLLFEAISVNTNYTSKIEVRLHLSLARSILSFSSASGIEGG